jgi:hypothetical protein
VHLVASETLVSSVMHQKPMEVSLVTAGMLVPTEMHLRPEELCLLLLKCWWLLKCTLGLRRCTAARHSLLPQVHIHRYQCASVRHTSTGFRCISADTSIYAAARHTS